MKTARVCVMLLLALILVPWTQPAAAEGCLHKQLTTIRSITQCQDYYDGHAYVEQAFQRCEDCGKAIIRKTAGDLQGHVLHMAESVHCEADGIHVYVFICEDCLHPVMQLHECGGGEACTRIQAAVGETPPVKTVQCVDDWYTEHILTEIVQRWLLERKAE